MKNNNLIVVLLIALGIAVGVYFYFKKKNDDAKSAVLNFVYNGNVTTPTPTPTPTATPVILPVGTAPLKIGSRGKMVQMVQVLCGVTPDGIWGKNTQLAYDKTKLKPINTVWEFIKIIAPEAGRTRFPLEFGKQNSTSYVKILQIISNIKIDGIFGGATKDALEKSSVSFADYRNFLADLLKIG
jgi:hypothetical protein